MDSVTTILAELRKKGVMLTPCGHRLRLQGPANALSDGDRELLRDNRLEIVKKILDDATIQHSPFELSNIQSRMPLGQSESRSADHVRSLHAFTGDLDLDILSSAAQSVLQQNPILRTTFTSHIGVVQQQINPAPFFKSDLIRLEEKQSALDAVMEYVDRPFELTKPPLFRIGVLPPSNGEHGILAIVAHHALVDGFSSSQINRALSKNYNILASNQLPEIGSEAPIIAAYRDYCQKSTSTPTRPTIDHWKKLLGEHVVGSFVPCDEENPYQGVPEFKVKTATTDPELNAKVEAALTENSCSMAGLSLALTGAIVRMTSGTTDVMVGTTLSDRFNVASEESISNMALDLVTRVHVDLNQDASAYLNSVQAQLNGIIEAPYCPIEKLVSEGMLPPIGQRQLRMPLATANYEATRSMNIDGLESNRIKSSHENPFLGMSIRTVKTAESLEIEFEYDTKLMSESRIEGLAQLAIEVLRFIGRNSNELLASIQVPKELQSGTALHPKHHAKDASNGEHHSNEPVEYPNEGIESIIAGLWSAVLEESSIHRADGFFALGGDSLKLVRFIDRAHSESGIQLSITDFIGDPPLKIVAEKAGRQVSNTESKRCIPLSNDRTPQKVFCLPGIGGVPAFSFRAITLQLEGRASIQGIQLPGIDGHSHPASNMSDLVDWVVDAIIEHRDPDQPIIIAGYSIGGLIAMEARERLNKLGEHTLDPILIGTKPPLSMLRSGFVNGARKLVRRWRFARQVRRELGRNEALAATNSGGVLERRIALGIKKTQLIFSRYSPASKYEGSCCIFLEKNCRPETSGQWTELVGDTIRFKEIDTSHNDILEDGTDFICEEVERLIKSI